MTRRKSCRIVVLISGSGTNLQALIDAADARKIDGDIVAVISNRPNAKGLEKAKLANITTQVIDHKQFPTRELFDLELLRQLQSYQPDLVILAGFMRILSPQLVEQFPGKMLNIHPSLLPKYRGLKTHQRAIESNDSEHGASVHFVTADLDGGPVILQAKLTLRADHTPESLAQELLPLEHQIFPKVVRWICAGRLKYRNHELLLDQKVLTTPKQLSDL